MKTLLRLTLIAGLIFSASTNFANNINKKSHKLFSDNQEITNQENDIIYISAEKNDRDLEDESNLEKESTELYNVDSKSKQIGIASWYGKKFHGRKTASGKTFNMYELTAAHKTLPLNSKIKVTNLKNHKSVILKVTDRGPYSGKRILDVSYAAAKELGFNSAGTTQVKVEKIF